MLRLDKIIGGEISGLNSEEVEFLQALTENQSSQINQHTGLSMEQQVTVNNAIEHAYQEISEEIKEKIRILEQENISKSTEQQTKIYVNKFKKFLQSQNIPDDLDKIPNKYMSQYMRWWYTQLRKEDGSLYAPSTLICIRSALFRYFLSTTNVNIIHDPEFNLCNKTFKALIAKYLSEVSTKSSNNGTKLIEEQDLLKLRTYFDRSTPERLQHEVFYSIVSHFGLRGREWLRNTITKSSIALRNDAKGNEYVDLILPDKEKNVNPDHFTSNKQSVMYANNNKNECPVEAVKMYTARLPEGTNVFFLKPKSYPSHSESVWYFEKCPLGKNKLGDFMKTISQRAALSQIYTNHSIRATVVTTLVNDGFSTKEIKSVTGHKSDKSIDRYTKNILPSKKMKLSHSLSRSISGDSGFNETNVDVGEISDNNKNKCNLTISSNSNANANVSSGQNIFGNNCSFNNCSFIFNNTI